MGNVGKGFFDSREKLTGHVYLDKGDLMGLSRRKRDVGRGDSTGFNERKYCWYNNSL